MYIRFARRDDAAGIAALHIASWRATYRDEVPAEFLGSLDLNARTADWEEEIAGDAHVLVADGGVRDPTDAYIRERLRSASPAPR